MQGPPAAVEAFVAWCRRGPPLARVRHDVDVAIEVELGCARDRSVSRWRVRPPRSLQAEDVLPRGVRRRGDPRQREHEPDARWSRARASAARTNTPRAAAKAGTLAQERAQRQRKRRAHVLAVEQRGHRHEGDRQRREHAHGVDGRDAPRAACCAASGSGSSRFTSARLHAAALSATQHAPAPRATAAHCADSGAANTANRCTRRGLAVAVGGQARVEQAAREQRRDDVRCDEAQRSAPAPAATLHQQEDDATCTRRRRGCASTAASPRRTTRARGRPAPRAVRAMAVRGVACASATRAGRRPATPLRPDTRRAPWGRAAATRRRPSSVISPDSIT